MTRKDAISALLKSMSIELLEFIKESEESTNDRWVSAVDINNALDLNFLAVPLENKKQYGQKGWLLAILTRKLEDEKLVEYKKEGSRAFYRSKKP